MHRPTSAFIVVAALLAGCEQLGVEFVEKPAVMREADGKAIGGACRHAGRAIEDCYTIYKKADRAAVFAGWRDMNDYMRENKIEAVAPRLGAPVAGLKPDKGDEDAEKVVEGGKAASARSKEPRPADS
jgi:hypothetical protein